MTSKIYILLPVHNRKAYTRGFVECLKAQTFTDYHLVLIDDGSTDGTEEMVKENIPSVTALRGSGDWWWAGCLQQGLNWLKKNPPKPSDIILMINDDVTFKPDFLEKGVRFLQKFPQSLLQANFYDAQQGKVIEMGRGADYQHMGFPITETQESIKCLSTRGLFLRWDVCMKVGGFHPFMLPHYGSDSEYTIRAGRKGFALRTSPEVFLAPDLEATGTRDEGHGIGPIALFSKRCTINPLYWTSFILLTFPVRWIPINVARVWLRAFLVLLRWVKT